MRNFLGSCNDANLIQGSDLRTQSTMHTQHFTIHNSCQCKKVKDLATCLPDRCVAVLCLAFLVKSVDLGNLPGLVVATDECDAIGKSVRSAVKTKLQRAYALGFQTHQ